jgi:hypothetical protein
MVHCGVPLLTLGLLSAHNMIYVMLANLSSQAHMHERQVQGVIDENTLVWGQGLQDWLPVRNIRTLVPQIRTPEGAGQSAV